MKLIIEISSISELNLYVNNQQIAGFIVGINQYSLNSYKDMDIKTINQIYYLAKKAHKILIINIAAILTDELINQLKNDLNHLNSDYYMYSDMGVHELFSHLGLLRKLIYLNHTYLTNYYDINEYANYNHKVVVSNQIPSDELYEICKNLSEKQILDIFGLSSCFYSRRPLLSNFFSYYNKSFYKARYYLQEELRQDLYPIIEDSRGTHIYEASYHYLLEELEHIQKIEWGIIFGKLLSKKIKDQIVKIYCEYLNGKHSLDQAKAMLLSLPIKISKGSYNQKTYLHKRKGDSSEKS